VCSRIKLDEALPRSLSLLDNQSTQFNVEAIDMEFVLCIDNSEYEASLILRKVYPVMSDPKGAKDGLVRIVDESGEEYLYDKSHFILVDFPNAVAKAILRLAGVRDPILSLGEEPIVDDVSDASENHDRYIYQNKRRLP
jgi:hypothetical protein